MAKRDQIRIFMDSRLYFADPTQTVYEIMVDLPGDAPVCILATRNRKEALSRYNALTVTQEPAPQEEG